MEEVGDGKRNKKERGEQKETEQREQMPHARALSILGAWVL
jgi:hypothetical protein